jgi:hypothetical protein
LIENQLKNGFHIRENKKAKDENKKRVDTIKLKRKE